MKLGLTSSGKERPTETIRISPSATSTSKKNTGPGATVIPIGINQSISEAKNRRPTARSHHLHQRLRSLLRVPILCVLAFSKGRGFGASPPSPSVTILTRAEAIPSDTAEPPLESSRSSPPAL